MKSIVVSILVFVIGFTIAVIFGNIFGGGSPSYLLLSAIFFSVLYLASIVTYFGMQISKALNM